MIVEIGAEAALFPEKEYISGIFVAVQEQKSIGADFSQRSSRRYQRSSRRVSPSRRMNIVSIL
jgi:hypothetical protein